ASKFSTFRAMAIAHVFEFIRHFEFYLATQT
ncbi:hypothetical protein D018_1157B, partial [Vibrio parahaemolyticus VP2007-007]